MRMTNKIMRNNSLYNINQNKLLEDRLTNQMTTQSKIARPSDDPVVAIRALRLRTNVTYVTQYYEKNAEDANQWLTMTSDALTTIGDILKDLYEKATSAADKDLTSDDLDIILTQMKSLTNEFYSSGNVDYAGRYIFSGYRTDTAITFSAEDIKEMAEHPSSFNIKEKFGYENIDSFYYTNYNTLTENDPTTDPNMDLDGIRTDGTSYEQDITNTKLYRIRLAYDDVYAGSIPVFYDELGNEATPQPTIREFADAEEAYRAISDADFRATLAPPFDPENDIAYIPSTGELVFSEKYYDTNYANYDKNRSFSISYDKSDWEEGDINPVHYFECTETKTIGEDENGDEKTKTIKYNVDNVTTLPQDIYYDVGFNQKIQVNTLASDVFTHDVQRDMDDFQRCITQLRGIETELSDIEKKMAEYPEDSDEYKNLAQKKAAAEKARTYIRENIHNQFENQITKYQNYLDDANVADTNNASRGSRLTLISKRLMNQQATFKDLQTDNESIDVTQAAVELTSSEMIYQAALLATSKIMQTNLMNYI